MGQKYLKDYQRFFDKTKSQLGLVIIIDLILWGETRKGEFEMNSPLKNKKKCTTNQLSIECPEGFDPSTL